MFDGVVAKINSNDEDKIFLFFLDKEKIIRDGINIQDDGNIYQELSYDTLMVVEVILKDGTKEIDIDIDDFLGGEYGKYDIFIHIKDIYPFRLGKKSEDDPDDFNFRTIKSIIFDGEFQDIAKECIEMVKNDTIEIENKEDV